MNVTDNTQADIVASNKAALSQGRFSVTKQALSTGAAAEKVLTVEARRFCLEDAVLSAGSFWSKIKGELGTEGDEVTFPTEKSFSEELDMVGSNAVDSELNYGCERLANALMVARHAGFEQLVVKLH